jgi:hypothetical protein
MRDPAVDGVAGAYTEFGAAWRHIRRIACYTLLKHSFVGIDVATQAICCSKVGAGGRAGAGMTAPAGAVGTYYSQYVRRCDFSRVAGIGWYRPACVWRGCFLGGTGVQAEGGTKA